MNMRWWITLSVVAALGLLTAPVLAQPYVVPGPMHTAWGPQTTGQPLSIVQAEAIARQVLAQSGYAGLTPGHIMEFSNNFYVAVKYKTSGQGAFEFLIDRYTGFVHPEPQSMMWNTQFGHMSGRDGLWRGTTGNGMMNPSGGGSMMGPGGGPGGGMMGSEYTPMGPGMMGPSSTVSGAPSITLAQAKTLAKKFLDTRLPGATLDDAIAFPGYYTLDVARDGKVIGMLSVNAYSGQVWYHNWHGTFIEEKDLE